MDLSENAASSLPVNESELKTLLLQIPGGVAIAEAPTGRLIYQNAEAAALMRHPMLHSGNYEHYIHGALHQDGSRYRPAEYPIARALMGEVVKQEELLYRRGDGTLAYFLVNAMPIRDRDNAIVKVLYHFFDISDRHKSEAALKASEQRLELALSGANLGLWNVDITNGNATADDRLFALLGFEPGEIKPSFNVWLSIVHIEDKQKALDSWLDHLEGKTPLYEATFRARTAQGKWKWILARGRIVERDDEGRPLLAAGTMLDIDHTKKVEISLRESKEQFRSTLQQAPIGIATVTPSGRWLSANPKMCEILGYSASEVLQQENVRHAMHPDDQGRFNALLDKLLHNELQAFTVELRYIRKDGATIWADLNASSVSQDTGRIKYLIIVLEDKTAKKLAEKQLQEMQAQLRMATQIVNLGFWEWHPHTNEIFFSPEWKAQLGYRDDEFLNLFKEWETRVHPDDLDHVLLRLDAFLAAPSSDFVDEFRMRHKDGTYRWISSRGMPLISKNGEVYKMVGTHLDITEQKLAQETIRQTAQHDVLTGLPNRSLLYEFSEHLIASARRSATPLAVLFIDLDRFKAVNDIYGHKIGDGILKEAAHRLGHLMRAEDIISRLGGDEFVAVLPKIRDRRDAAVVAAKALESFGKPYYIDEFELSVSPSIGISLFPQDGTNIDTLIQNADTAMYKVKAAGCNNYQFFTRELNNESDRQTALEQNLRLALEREEFDLHYQPVLDTTSGAIVGVEALIRWPRGADSRIAPAAFIPVAETSGLIMPLGEWILQQACSQHREWLRQGLPPISIAVNISPVQLRNKEFRHTVSQIIAATGIDPAWLEMEVADGAVMKDFDNAANMLQALKDIGVKIALDTFGVGNVNLNHLARLSLDRVKLDQSFVRNFSSDKISLAITEAIIAMARSLNIDIVAGGIESASDLHVLQEHQCRHAQGFYLGRPMSGHQFAQWHGQHGMH